MQSKILEIRDKETCIPVLAIKMLADNPIQDYYLHYRSGYPRDGSSIMVMVLSNGNATNDPYDWGKYYGPRTMPNAPNYIIIHFDSLNDGDVVDVQFILKETKERKISERFNALLVKME